MKGKFNYTKIDCNLIWITY